MLESCASMKFLLQAALIAGLIALNAFFVAAEYALLSVRRTRLEELAQAGDSRARTAQALIADMGLLISGIQLAITVAGLLMGALGEPILAAAIQRALEGVLQGFVSTIVAHTLAVGVAFAIITTLMMVLGELVPKAITYHHAERAALLIARPLSLYMQISKYPVRALDWMAGVVLNALGQTAADESATLHTPDEVKLIVAGIRKRGLLGVDQEDMIHSVIDLQNIRVREILVPRPKITCLPMTSDLNFLLVRAVEDRYTRVPIYDGSPDHIVGILNTKDLLRVALDRMRMRVPLDAPLDLRSLLYQPMIVPEAMSLAKLLDEARQRHSQIALIVDEFGTFVGMLTMEDILEQIVGEIQDEYDREEKAIQQEGENVLVVDGSLNLRDLADGHGIELERDSGYETVAGFVLARLGLIPRGGESFVHEGRRYSVLEMDGRRVSRVRVETLPAAPVQSGKPPH